MRSRRLIASLSAAAALTMLGAAAGTAEAAPRSPSGAAVVCIPEAPVCYGITGNATQGYGFGFTLKPPPLNLSLSFTVNGLAASGSLSYTSTPTLLRGEFRPFQPLVVGDTVCMYVGINSRGYCETVV
ncbi:hypothetical protein AB0H86_30000 [Streptomyces sp. NPDC050997]|uniref:hypothetical protein n=1 Tax=Streptomyces sp. NPDC050997 TaxID=3155519 RepID=UPI003421907C